MSRQILVGAAFRARYAIRRFRDGGILVDLATGTYLHLNVSAANICSILGETEDIELARSELARGWGGADDDAGRMIRDVVEGLGRLGPRREPLGALRYLPAERGGYVLTSNGAPRMLVSADGTSVQLASPRDPLSAAQIYGYLRAIAPKVLFLQSTVVIHGAASRVRDGVRVISGESGAGKTTTARAFDAVGANLFAEDMLVVASTSPLNVYSGGEKVINTWAGRSAEQLGLNSSKEIDASPLRATTLGEQAPVSEIWFIDGSRRRQDRDEILPRRLGETAGALLMMTGMFLGSATPEAWRVFLSLIGSVAETVPLFEASMPAGLDRLQVAAHRYTENSAS